MYSAFALVFFMYEEETNTDELKSQSFLSRGCWAAPRLRLPWLREIQPQGKFLEDFYLLTCKMLQIEGFLDWYAPNEAFVKCWWVNPRSSLLFKKKLKQLLPTLLFSELEQKGRDHLTRTILICYMVGWQYQQWTQFLCILCLLWNVPNDFCAISRHPKHFPNRGHSLVNHPGLFF